MACVPGLGGDTSEDEQASSRAPDGKRICQRARLKSPTVAEALDDLLLTYTIDLSVFAELKPPKLEAHIQRGGVVFFERLTPQSPPRAGEYFPVGQNWLTTRNIGYPKSTIDDLRAN